MILCVQCIAKEARWKQDELLDLPENTAGGRTWCAFLCLPKLIEELLVVPSSDGQCLPKLKEVATSNGPLAVA